MTAKAAEKREAKEREETTELREATAAQWKTHPKSELHVTVPSDGKGADVEIDAQDGYVVIDTHGAKRFDRDALTTLQKQLQAAFQVVA